jgi:hypothetical protein
MCRKYRAVTFSSARALTLSMCAHPLFRVSTDFPYSFHTVVLMFFAELYSDQIVYGKHISSQRKIEDLREIYRV